jgi:polyisoprenoid-binding protein YceI
MKFYNLLAYGLVLFVSSCSNEGTTPNEDTNTEPTKTELQSTIVGDLGIPDGKYTLTKEKHSITWEASKITGSTHSGIIKAGNGKFKVEDGSISRGVVSFEMNSFEVTDIKGEDKANFDGHLKSEDFLDIEKFPVARLMMNGSSTAENGKMNLSCSFDFHGVVVDYIVPFTVEQKKMTAGKFGYQINGKFMLDRTKHNITYGSGSVFDDLGDRVINDDVKIVFKFTAL